MSVKRYMAMGGMLEYMPGGWVRYADHAAEVARLEARIDVLAQAVRAWKWHDAMDLGALIDDPCDPAWGESYQVLASAMARALEVIE